MNHLNMNLLPRSAYSSTRKEDWYHSKPVTITFVSKDGEKHEVTGPTGQDLLTLAHDNGIELEGTITMAISTFSFSCDDAVFRFAIASYTFFIVAII
jgi:hypothetical protein